MRVLTWNLFHGRSVPGAGRELLAEFAAALAGWKWDVALLQEVPPWWPAELAAACGAQERHVLTSRNALLPLRRLLARRWPDLVRSNGGGCDAILVRGQGIAEHRAHRLRWWPERRMLHAVRLANGAWVANAHAQGPTTAELLECARVVGGWAGDAPFVLGGDFNTRDPEVPGLLPLAHRDVDHLFARGFEVAGPAARLEHGRLSDHPPLTGRIEPRPASTGT